MHLIEYSVLVGSVCMSVTYLLVKCLAQLNKSKCTKIDCCGISMVRDLSADFSDVDVATPIEGRV